MATKTKARSAPAKKAAKARSPAARAPAGPLTLAQARALVQAAQPAPKAAPRAARASRAAAPRRAASPGAMRAAAAATTPASIAIERRKLAIAEREDLKQRMRDYKATFALLQKHGVKGLTAAAPAARARRRRAPGAAAPAPGGPLRILAEGDSWFDYPVPFFGGGLVPRLEQRLGVPILNLAKAGDESRYMLGVEQRQLIAQQFRNGAPDGNPWELMLFSGGGNDIVADPLALWLRDFSAGVPPAQLLNGPRFASALALVRAAYEDLIEIRNLLSPQTHLVFHAYDFVLPDGRGICHLGPWLKPAFDLRGFPGDLVASGQVVREMLQQFAAMLGALATQPRVTFINAQGTLAPVKASWHNEMHPSKGGFNQIANIFHAGIKALFPGRVL
jgi:hypothetical protein